MNEFFETLDRLYQTAPQQVEAYLLETLATCRAQGLEGEAASVMNELGGYYRGVSRYGDSLRYTRESMAIWEAQGLHRSVQFATMLLNYAGLQRLMGQLAPSRDSFLRAKALLEELGETGHYAYVSLLNNLALTQQELGEMAEAIRLMEQSLALLRARPRQEDEIPTALNNLAAMHLRQGDTVQAEARVREALEGFAALPESSAHEAAAWGTLGVILYGQRRYEAAEAAFLRAAEGTKAVFGENVDAASALRSLAFTRQALGRRAAAAEAMGEAVRILSALLGEAHPRVNGYRQELEALEAEA